MNKTIAVIFAVAAISSAVFAAANDVLLTFSTQGPDKYSDGTSVLDGECYALVYTPKGKTFAGFAADGTEADPATGKIVLCAPVAKNGHCPYVAFQIDADVAAAEYPSGTWAVYLLDTRRYDVNGVAKLAGTRNGKPVMVNASGFVTYGNVTKPTNGAFDAIASTGAAQTSGASEVPGSVPSPRITDIKVIDGYVYITVQDTVPFINYTLKEGDTPTGLAADPAHAPQSGDEKEEIIFVSPDNSKTRFFSVGRK